MAKLSYSHRKKMPKSEFALPSKKEGGKGGYPIPDKSHARNALARVSQHGSSSEKAKVRAAVHRKFPSIGQKTHGGSTMISTQSMKGSALVHGRRDNLASKDAFRSGKQDARE